MRKFNIDTIKKICESVVANDADTGDDWLDNRYNEQRKFAGGYTLPYYRVAYQIAKRLAPKFVVELGTFQATWSAHVASAAPKSTVVTIDIHKDPGQEIDAQLAQEAADVYPNLHPLIGWTWDDHIVAAVKEWADVIPIDTLFIDAWHNREYVEREWNLYKPMLADRALIVCDDITNNSGIFEDMEAWWDTVPYEKFLDNNIHRGVPQGFFIYDKWEDVVWTSNPE